MYMSKWFFIALKLILTYCQIRNIRNVKQSKALTTHTDTHTHTHTPHTYIHTYIHTHSHTRTCIMSSIGVYRIFSVRTIEAEGHTLKQSNGGIWRRKTKRWKCTFNIILFI